VSAAAPEPQASSRLKSLADRLKQASSGPSAITVAIDSIEPNPHQPRKGFDQAKLAELAESIRTHGVVQPVVARPAGQGRYQLVAGERRWRAAKLAGLREVPAVVRELSEDAMLAISLVENLDREDMAPADEVSAVALLAVKCGVQDTARQLGKPPAWVSKRKRIAEAPEFVRDFVNSGASSDIEALYELAKLAETDEEAAQDVIAGHAAGMHLRNQVKAAARAPQAPPHEDEDAPNDGTDDASIDEDVSHAKSSIGGDKWGAGSSGTSDGERESDDPTDAPRAGRTDSTDRALVVTTVAKRKKRLILVTESGDEVPCELTDDAWEQLRNLVGG
jgi:ParB family chromosome partitioning protein